MQRALKPQHWDAVIILLIILEILLLLYTHQGGSLPAWLNESGFTVTSLFIGIAFALRYRGRDVSYEPLAASQSQRWIKIAALTLPVAGLLAAIPFLSAVFREMPIGKASDIIPTIAVAARRFLGGEVVYKSIDEWGYLLPLTYLPMQWLPYTLAEWLGFDYRWIAVAIFFLSALTVVWRCSCVSAGRGLITALLFLFFAWMLSNDKGIIGLTVELMVAGYYMLLITGISGRNPWLRGIAIALCLLSRYSLVLWLPLWAAVEWAAASRKDFYRSAIIIITMMLVIYVIPFLSHDWGTFLRGYQYYTVAALGEWGNVNDHGVPYQLDQGVGFARLFYQKLWQYTVPDRLRSLQKVHFALSLGSAVVMGLAYFAGLRRKLHPRIFLLASFKIYLSLFLGFIQVPYTYLMITAIAVSIAIFAEMGRWRIVSE